MQTDPLLDLIKQQQQLYAQQQAMQNSYGSMLAQSAAPSLLDWRHELYPRLVKVAEDLGLAYIDPTLSPAMIQDARAGEYKLIEVKYAEMLKYYNISKDMVTI